MQTSVEGRIQRNRATQFITVVCLYQPHPELFDTLKRSSSACAWTYSADHPQQRFPLPLMGSQPWEGLLSWDTQLSSPERAQTSQAISYCSLLWLYQAASAHSRIVPICCLWFSFSWTGPDQQGSWQINSVLKNGTGEIAQRLRALTGLPEVLYMQVEPCVHNK